MRIFEGRHHDCGLPVSLYSVPDEAFEFRIGILVLDIRVVGKYQTTKKRIVQLDVPAVIGSVTSTAEKYIIGKMTSPFDGE